MLLRQCMGKHLGRAAESHLNPLVHEEKDFGRTKSRCACGAVTIHGTGGRDAGHLPVRERKQSSRAKRHGMWCREDSRSEVKTPTVTAT